MTFTFSSSLPAEFESTPIVISGPNSLQFNGSEYLIVEKENEAEAFEIRFQYHCSPFKQAMIVDKLLLVGHEAQFYLYDLMEQQHVLTLEMSGYFGHFYIHQESFYIADSCGLFSLNTEGHVLWRNSNLGIDGVTIERFTNERIYGSGEWDPPGGWQDFVLDLNTGKELKEHVG